MALKSKKVEFTQDIKSLVEDFSYIKKKDDALLFELPTGIIQRVRILEAIKVFNIFREKHFEMTIDKLASIIAQHKRYEKFGKNKVYKMLMQYNKHIKNVDMQFLSDIATVLNSDIGFLIGHKKDSEFDKLVGKIVLEWGRKVANRDVFSLYGKFAMIKMVEVCLFTFNKKIFEYICTLPNFIKRQKGIISYEEIAKARDIVEKQELEFWERENKQSNIL